MSKRMLMKLFSVQSIGFLLLFSRVESHSLRVDLNDAARVGRWLQQTGSTESSVATNVNLSAEDAEIDVEPESYVSFDGPQSIFGLELNTTSYSQIKRKALGGLLSTLLYNHLRLELPVKYNLKSVEVVDIQYLSLESIRKDMVRGLQAQEKRHQFVVTAGTKFSTEDFPTQDKISAIVLDGELAVCDFWSSDDSALKSTTGVKLFQLSSVDSALVAQEEPSADKSSILGGHSTLIFAFFGLALVVLLVGAAFYYRKTKVSEINYPENDIDEGPSFVSEEFSVKTKQQLDATEKELEVALQLLDTKKQQLHETKKKLRDTEKNLAQMRDVVLLEVSESESDDSLASERGLDTDGFACVSPKTLVNEIVHEIAEDDGFSCALSLSPEDVWNDSTDIDTFVAEKKRKQGAKRGVQRMKETETNDLSDDSLVAHSYSGSESFSMISVESEQDRCEGFDCGVSLAG